MAKGKEMEAILKIVGNLDPSLEKAVAGATKAISGIGKGMAVAGTAVVAGMATVGAATIAASKAALDLGMAFDEASDTIRIGTGATGEALDSLNASFDEVYKSVPTTMEAASQAIADYNTRLGLTGPELENISEQAIQVSNMLGDDLGGVIESSSQAFQQWDISANDMGDAMDYVFKASQSTGVGFTDLMNNVQQFGPQMQEMGFSFEETTALLGQLDKAGVNSTEVMSALKKSVTTMANDGLSASEGLQQYIAQIQEAGSVAEATSIAAEVFGSRAGSTMAVAIRDGTLSVQELTSELLTSDETIMKAAEDTEDFPQKLQKLKASAQVALKPIANQFMDIANDAIPLVEEALEQTMPIVSSIMANVAPIIANIAGTLIPMVSDAIQAMIPTIQGMLPMVQGAIEGIGSAIQGVAPFVQEALTWALDAVSQLMPFLMNLGASIMPVLLSAGQAIFGVIQAVMPVLMEIISAVLPIVSQVLSTLAPIIQNLMSAITPIIALIGRLVSALLPPIVSYINMLLPIITTVANVITSVLCGALQFLTPIIEAQIAKFEALGSIVSTVFGAMKGIVKGGINAVVGLVNKAIGAINSISIDLPEWAGGGHLGFSIPLIPMLAKGGFTDGISIAGEAGTEAVISFDSAYRSANLDYWMKAGQLLGALNNDGSVNSESALAGKLLTFDNFSLSELASAGQTTYVYDFSGMQYSPTINTDGSADKADWMSGLERSKYEFTDWLEEWLKRKEEAAYA